MWWFLRKLKIELLYDPAIPLLGIYPEKIIIQKDMHKNTIFIVTLCTITSTWAQPFFLLYLQFHTPSWLLSISINMYENLSHYQRCSPQFPALLLTLSSHSQAPMSTSYRNCLHVLTFHLHFSLKVLSCACPTPTPNLWKYSLLGSQGLPGTKSDSTFLSLNYLPFRLFGAFNFLIYSLLFWRLFSFIVGHIFLQFYN